MTPDKQYAGFIEAPSRLPFFGITVVLLVVGVLSIALVSLDGGGIWSLALLSGLLLVALILRLDYAIHAALLALLTLLLVNCFPHFQIWPFSILLPLTAYGVIVSLTPSLRQSVGWIRKGSMNSDVIRLIIITVIVSAFALVAWMLLLKPDIEHHLALVPDVPVWTYPLIGIFFAVFNAVMEESVYRGILMEALDSALGESYWSVCIQALPFAALHYLSGFPNGGLGFIMTLVYGIMLGAIRRLSKGMLAPVVAHIAADLTIFSIVAFIIVQSGYDL